MTKGYFNFEAVLFDLDGTLYDSEALDRLSLTRLLECDLGLDMTTIDVQDYLGIPSQRVLQSVAPPKRMDELLARWLVYQDELREQANLYPDVRPTLRWIKKSGVKMGVVTSQNRSELNATRQHIQIDNLIQVWVSASDTEHTKPHPAPVLKALKELGIKAEQAIMIGDSLSDLQAGRSAGTRLGAVLWGAGFRKALLEFKPEYVFESVLDIQNFVRNYR